MKAYSMLILIEESNSGVKEQRELLAMLGWK